MEYRALSDDFKHRLSRRTGGNLTWHEGRGQNGAGGRAVKLLQQPGTEALQVPTGPDTIQAGSGLQGEFFTSAGDA